MAVKIMKWGGRELKKNVIAKIAFNFCSEMHSFKMSLKDFVDPIISKYSDTKNSFFLCFRMLLIQG